jgi:hypothetical protein
MLLLDCRRMKYAVYGCQEASSAVRLPGQRART